MITLLATRNFSYLSMDPLHKLGVVVPEVLQSFFILVRVVPGWRQVANLLCFLVCPRESPPGTLTGPFVVDGGFFAFTPYVLSILVPALFDDCCVMLKT
jgi:hypothetical protein